MDFGWDISDTPTSLLVAVNLVQMIIILILLLPIIDIVILSKHVRDFNASIKNSPLTISLLLGYGVIVIFYGILCPTKVLTELKHSKQAREGETPEDILRRIIQCTNASRNYILGAFSLFYVLVIVRLFDFVTFSAKLVEFSELMANYDLVDIALIDEPDFNSTATSLITEIIEEEEEEDVPWPITADFNKAERSQIRTFLRDPPKKLAVLARKANKTLDEDTDKNQKDKLDTDTETSRKTSDSSIKTKSKRGAEEIFEILPTSNKEKNIETINNSQENNSKQASHSTKVKEDKDTDNKNNKEAKDPSK